MSVAATNSCCPSDCVIRIPGVKIARAPWASGSFLLYVGALFALFGAVAWLSVISDEHGHGAFAGWSVLFWAVAEFLALWFLMQGRRVAAGLLAFVGLGMWAVMIGAFFSWFGWLSNKGTGSAFSGFHVGDLLLVLLVLIAAVVDLKIWRFPLLVLPTIFLTWYFITDVISNGGNWTNVVSLLLGLVFMM